MWKGVLIWAIFFASAASAQNLKISVYYETLCPDSIRFLVNEFYPTYQDHAEHMEVDLVPYGKANATNSSGSWVFQCQHGPAECYGNKVHSCAVDLYPVNQSTEFVVCAMSSTNASSDVNLEQCAVTANISWTTLQECISSGQGDELLAANGRRTDELIPDLINFVPTIVFQDVFNNDLHTVALNNFGSIYVYLLEQVHCGFCHFNGSGGLIGSVKAQNVKVSVYYETLCPYSANFLVSQFYPTYQNHAGQMEVDLIPYGKANATNDSGTWTFECQHGPAECYGNKVHSCALHLFSIEQSTEFVVCSMNSSNATSDTSSELCATSSNISWTTLKECVSSNQGDELLAANGRRTDKVIPVLINSIPTIIFNDVFNNELRNIAASNFENIFWFLYEQIQCEYCYFSGSAARIGSATFVLGIAILLLMVEL
ncbi:hypothetical protein NQ315_016887 [Exocentrus adspersus]|uniref:Gamma-interferon-inducible lysosomal thiol reductase n=1 Tax=Exocentrus adspersus TaxID=1586481 RepID=A0AAV8VXJ1_9CUCU|nr:hypothetical protein NQ315_016887 [Exocentrus adspersus]